MFSNTEKFLEKRIFRLEAQPLVDTNNVHESGTEIEPLLVNNVTNKFTQVLNFRRKKTEQRRTSIPKAKRQQDVENKFTWWTKFYNSLNQEHSGGIEKHLLTIFNCELENIAEFSNLTDWAEPMSLLKGTNSKKLSGPKDITYGTLKCNIRVIKTSESENKEAVIDMRNNR